MKKLNTLVKMKPFSYEGSVSIGTIIYFGAGRTAKISSLQFESIFKEFDKKIVVIGTSRTNPQRGSLGERLINNVTKQAIASYIVPILINEGFARKVDKDKIFIEKRPD
ncbi:hypothetical protein ACTSEZ_16360 [Metabacillus sp. JX24]|uniref:hypothetical protein n=1 Tax=Metabacillus sp. JX24 TaxID=3240759 RepID=UPI003510B775